MCSGSESRRVIRRAPACDRKGQGMRALWVTAVLSVALSGCDGSGQVAPEAGNGTQMLLVCIGLDLERKTIRPRPKVIDMRELVVGKGRGWSSSTTRLLTAERWHLSYNVTRVDEQSLRTEVCLDIEGGSRDVVTSSMGVEHGQTSVAFLPSGEPPRFAAVFLVVSPGALGASFGGHPSASDSLSSR